MTPTSTIPTCRSPTLFRAWPATARVFLAHRTACVGCPIAPFHTVARHLRRIPPRRGRLPRGAAAGGGRRYRRRPAQDHEPVRRGHGDVAARAPHDALALPGREQAADGVQRRPGHLGDVGAGDREGDLDPLLGLAPRLVRPSAAAPRRRAARPPASRARSPGSGTRRAARRACGRSRWRSRRTSRRTPARAAPASRARATPRRRSPSPDRCRARSPARCRRAGRAECAARSPARRRGVVRTTRMKPSSSR